MRDPSKTEPYLAEIAEQRHEGGRLPSSQFYLSNHDASIQMYKTRCGNGFSKSREIQYQMVIEKKYLHEGFQPGQMEHLVNLHAQMIRPFELEPDGITIKNNTKTRPIKIAKRHVVFFGVSVIRMDSDRADESSEIIWERMYLRLKNRSCKTECVLKDLKKFHITYDQYWDLLGFKLDPDNPNKKWDDRSHHKDNGVLVIKQVSELGYEFEELVKLKS